MTPRAFTKPRQSTTDRFRMKYAASETLSYNGTSCWIWLAGKDRRGYGMFPVNYGAGRIRSYRAHRFSYELALGRIPDGLDLDHLCRNHACVNPAHLEPVTHQVNCERGEVGLRFALKTHCPKGHPYSGDNLYPRVGARACRACRNAASAAYRAARRRLTERQDSLDRQISQAS